MGNKTEFIATVHQKIREKKAKKKDSAVARCLSRSNHASRPQRQKIGDTAVGSHPAAGN